MRALMGRRDTKETSELFVPITTHYNPSVVIPFLLRGRRLSPYLSQNRCIVALNRATETL